MTTKSVHEETVRIVDAQMKDMAIQMQILDDFVTRARLQNELHHETHVKSLHGLASTIKESHSNVSDHFTSTQDRIRNLDNDHLAQSTAMHALHSPLASTIQVPLSNLRTNIASAQLKEYSPTGETPKKVRYDFPTTLPRTESHERLLAKLERPQLSTSSTPSRTPPSPSKQPIYTDAPIAPPTLLAPSEDSTKTVPTPATPGLREIDLNIAAAGAQARDAPLPNFSSSLSSKLNFDMVEVGEMGPPPLKRQAITMESKLPQKHRGGGPRGEGRENALMQTIGRRRLRSSHLTE